MSKNTYGQYTPVPQVPTDKLSRGETTPFVELCESVVPGLGKGVYPAPYLPIQRYDKWIESGVVISVGVPVGFDNMGYLVPAGLAGGQTLTYTSYDVDMGVLSVDTGTAVAAAGAATIPTALCPTDGVIPVGIATYNIYNNLGGCTFTVWPTYSMDMSNPINYRLHNTTKEDAVAFTCDYVIEVPWIGATTPTGLTTAALSYAHAVGSFEYGGPVSCLTTNPGVFTPGTTRADRLFIGQVLGYRVYATPGATVGASTSYDNLHRVRTAEYAYVTSPNVSWQMPGSATKGIPRAIHLATDGAYSKGLTGWDSAGNYTSILINIQL